MSDEYERSSVSVEVRHVQLSEEGKWHIDDPTSYGAHRTYAGETRCGREYSETIRALYELPADASICELCAS